MSIKKKILICPLDWGLGHATRCIPVINELRSQGAGILLAASGRAQAFYEKELPGTPCIPFPGYEVRYSSGKRQAWKMTVQLPAILNGIRKEHEALKKIAQHHAIDGIISDNRFGCWHPSLPSVYMTHQRMVKMPFGLKWAEPLIFRYHRHIAGKYRFLWIPDYPGGENLSGDLAHKYPLPGHGCFTGPLSRFSLKGRHPERERSGNIRVLAIVSGPEPQRSRFEDLLTGQLKKYDRTSVLLAGRPESGEKPLRVNNLTVIPHLPSEKFLDMMQRSELILCRPGYSTIMDLHCLNKKAVLIPTPGQTEQEYLAERLKNSGQYYGMSQWDFDLEKALMESVKYRPLAIPHQPDLLRNAVRQFLKIL
ncbi:MAG: glycosyltransferase [Bacteroidales bacterium]